MTKQEHFPKISLNIFFFFERSGEFFRDSKRRLALVGPTGPTVGFLLLQHFSHFLLSISHGCFISVFV